PDVLDPALLRPGRFDRQITVDLPDRKGREAILKVHARNKKIASEVNFENIASRTPGFSGAELENVLNEAAILAVRTDKTEITTEDIDEAIDRVMGGPAKTSKIITPREKTLVAYHESGHAMVGLKLANAMRVQKVTIIPRGEAGGYVLMTPTDDRFLNTKGELLDRIAGLLAGRVSEEIFFDDVTTGAHNDIEQATKIARSMVTELGMSSLGPIQYERQAGSVFLGRDYTNSQRNFSSEVAYEIDKEIQKIVNESMARARKILLDNKDKVELIAKTLLDKETLTNEEVVSLVETGELPKKEKKVEPEVQPQVQQEIKEPTKEENVPSKEDSSESKE
ncbi:MAG: cell division protein FtsH, partial [Bacilli bacterium]|nr:cell division protein FtsH [Bacilli bacterium]